MDQPARMWKTLGCLVAAMTSTSILLAWLNPSPPPTNEIPEPDELARLALIVVGADLTVPEGRWNRIEIIEAPGRTTGGGLLAAAVNSGKCHFLVSSEGRPIRTRYWHNQQASLGAEHTIRIQVPPNRHRERTIAIQDLCLQALITALNEALLPEGGTLPVQLPSGWERYG